MSYASKIVEIRGKLQDEKSEEIFDARLQFMLDRDPFHFFDSVKEKKYISKEFEDFMKFSGGGREILIYGAGRWGMQTCEILRLCGYEPVAFSDSNVNLYNREIMGLSVISLDQLFVEKDKYVVVIASERYVSDIYRKLLRRGIERNYLFYPMRRIFTARSGWQYFDFFQANENEIFIDAGVYDAMTSVEFARWTNNNYKKIYLFEISKAHEKMCRRNLEKYGINNYELIMMGTWSKRDKVLFEENGGEAGGYVSEGNGTVDVISIDEQLAGSEATFIKMDVEGSEYQSLLGAKKTIQKYKPRLAISAYHKIGDFIELPALLSEINPEYHFAYRHYATNMWETVLYAW